MCHAAPITELTSEVIAALVFLLGVYLAYIFFLRRRAYATRLASSAVGGVLHRFWFSDWGMDWLYDRTFVRPLVWLARIDKGDCIDGFYTGVARVNEIAWRGSQTHRNRKVALVRGRHRGRIHCLHCGGAVPMILLWLIIVLLSAGFSPGRQRARVRSCAAGSRLWPSRSIWCWRCVLRREILAQTAPAGISGLNK